MDWDLLLQLMWMQVPEKGQLEAMGCLRKVSLDGVTLRSLREFYIISAAQEAAEAGGPGVKLDFDMSHSIGHSVNFSLIWDS